MNCIKTSLILMILQCSCTKTFKNNSYFNIEKYFDIEISKLSEINENKKFSINKNSFYNETSESKLIENVNWQNEFKVFKDLTINAEKYNGMYEIDTLKNKNKILIIYKAKKSKLVLRELQLLCDTAFNVTMINAYTYINTIFEEKEVNYNYQTLKGYSLKGYIKNSFGNKNEFDIFVTINNPLTFYY